MKISIFALFSLAASATAMEGVLLGKETYGELGNEIDELQTLLNEYEDFSRERSPRNRCPVFTQNPKGNTAVSRQMIDATKPCGYYQSMGCPYEVIPANLVHPGEGPGELQYVPYIVQFDIGVNRNIYDKVKRSYDGWNGGEKRPYLNPTQRGETCLELIVKGGSDATGGCAGKCGSGCSLAGGGYAKDCMKHDVCATYKALKQESQGINFDSGDGFCYDPDCGDEAASTLFNCFIDNWFKDTHITCTRHNLNKKNAYGHWSHSTIVMSEGPCGNFQNWSSGQGIPDKNKISNPY